jgi:phage/plasmid-associated DNA primase
MSKIGAKVLNGEFTIGEDGDNCAHVENNNKLWLAGQINRLDALGIQHISVDMDAGFKDGKFTKTVSGFGKYADIKRETNFNENKNATVLFMGNNYDNIILVDVDNVGDTVDTFLKFYEEQQIPECGLVETTINGGLHLYYKLDEEQHQQIKGFKSADKQMFPDFLPLDKKGKTGIDIKYTNQLSYGPAYVEAEEQVSKTGPPIIHKSKTEIIVSEGLFFLPDIIFNEIKRIYENKDIKKKPAEKKTSKKQEPVEEEEEAEPEEMRKSREAIDKELETEDMQKADEKLGDYLNLLKPERFDHRGDWLRIGAIIKNEGGSFNLFDKYSKQSDKYETVSTRKLWDSLIPKKDKQARMGSLKYMAKQDAPPETYKVVTLPFLSDIEKIWELDYTDEGIAKIFYSKYKDLFMYDPDKNKHGEWYAINEVGIWNVSNQYIKIDKKIAELSNFLDIELNKLLKDDEEFGECSPKCLKLLRTKLNNIIKKLNSTSSIKNIHEALKKYYASSPAFDKIPHLIGFNNGVYDASNFIFRKATPEEMVQATTGYDYKYIDETDALYKKIFNICESIHGDNLGYMLTCASLGLGGINTHEIIIFNIGKGSNGKSLYADILAGAFGNLSYKNVPSSYFEEEKNPTKSKADPMMLKFNNKRYIGSGEGKKKAILDSALLKSLSGNDIQEARNLYDSKIYEIVIMSIIMLYSNFLCQLDGDDDGICRRVRVVYYMFQFVDNPTTKTEKQIDRTIKNTINTDEFKNATFNILARYYNKYVNNKKVLVTPEKIKIDTDNYLNDLAPLRNYLNNNLILTTEQLKNKDMLNINDLYNTYKAGTDTPMDKIQFKNELIKKGFIFKTVNRFNVCINAIKTTQPEEDEEEDDTPKK